MPTKQTDVTFWNRLELLEEYLLEYWFSGGRELLVRTYIQIYCKKRIYVKPNSGAGMPVITAAKSGLLRGQN